MKKNSIIFGVVIIVIIIIIALASKGNNEKEKTQPEISYFSPTSQTMKKFIEISDKGGTTSEACEAYGGKVIFPINYEVLSPPNSKTRIFIVKEKET